MSKLKNPKPSGGRESFLIFLVVGCGLLATLSLNSLTKPDAIQEENAVSPKDAQPANTLVKKKEQPVTLIDVPLSTGDEPIDKLFVQSGCAVCHTIPGIDPAKGRRDQN